MSDRITAYLEAVRTFEQIALRCDGYVADLGQRHAALRSWQQALDAGAPAGRIEAALTDFFEGEPPGWAAVGSALNDWSVTAHEVSARWAALSADERDGLAPPAVPLLAEE